MKRFIVLALLATLFAALPCIASAEVINVAYWRGGENDNNPGPTGSFGPADATTTDATGNGNTLTAYHGENQQGPYYVYPGAVAESTVAYGFDPLQSNGYFCLAPVTTAITNWGIQAWVTGFQDTATRMYLLVGNGATASGYGILQYNGTFQGLFCGVTLIDSGVSPDGGWHNIALVNDNGITTLYVDYVAKATTTSTPGTPKDYTTIGGEINNGTPTNFAAGNIDEVRVFIFEPGKFQVSDLSNYVVPEPSTLTLLAAGLIGLLAYAWRRRR